MPYIKTLRDTTKAHKALYNKQLNIHQIQIVNPTNEKAKAYNSTGWRTLRERLIQYKPLCQLCMLSDTVKESEQLHHLIKFDSQPTTDLKLMLLLDEDNIVSLCKKHHTMIHYQTDMLSPEERQWIVKNKDRVYQLYLDKGLVINYTKDQNI